MDRRRTVFPTKVNFAGWWIKSPKGIVAELIREGTNKRGEILYSLSYPADKLFPEMKGAGLFTTDEMLDYHFTFHRTQEEARHAKRETPVGSAKVVG